MSIQVYDIQFRDENHELRTEKAILMDYFNKIAKECRNNTKGKTYDEIDEIPDRFKVFTNKLGYFEDKVNDTARDLLGAITYKPHKDELRKLIDTDIVGLYPDTENPLDDCNGMIKELRKKVKAIVKIYEQNEIREDLIRGYCYQKQ